MQTDKRAPGVPCFLTHPFLITVFALTAMAVLASAPAGFAQVDQGTISGYVTDSSGAVVPKATVEIVNVDTGLKLQTTTDAQGVYISPPLKVGHYDITASAVGFASSTVRGTEVQVNQKQAVNIALRVGTSTQTVQVSAENIPLLETQDASVAQEVSSKTVNDTPLNGRNYVWIAQLTAGVAPATDARGQVNGDFDANGQRPEQNNFILDGVDNNSSSADLLSSTSYSVKPPPDALAEFKIQTISYDAQLGHSAGAVINAAIKSGTNALHGDLWEYLRNDALDARQFNATTIPEYRQNQFGATIGGRIIRDHLFFFGDSEANRIVYGSPVFATVPTAAMRTGDFSELLNPALTGQPQPILLYQPGSGGSTPLTCNGQQNVLCANQISSVAQHILNLYPAPNTNGSLVYNNYAQNFNAIDNTIQWDGKIDWNISQKDQAFARMSYSNDRGVIPPPLGPILDGGGFGGDNLAAKVENVALSETHIFSPHWSNEFRVGENLMVIEHTQFNKSTDVSQQLGLGGIPYGPSNGGLPGVGISGISSFGSPGFYPALQHDNTFQILDNVNRVAGNQSIRAGVDFERVRFSYLEVGAPRGGYSYSGLYTSKPGTSFTGWGVADFLTDYQNAADLSQLSNVDHLHWYMAGYVQDDWTVSPRLTLNLGVRYDYYQPYMEIRDRQSNFVPLSMGLGTGSGVFLLPDKYQNLTLASSFYSIAAQDNIAIQCTSNRALSTASKDDFSPRIGIAYHPLRDLVLRSGLGIFYGGLEDIGGTLGQQYPFESTSSYLAPSCPVGGPCQTDGITLPVGFSNLAGPGPQSPVSYPGLVGRPLHYRDSYSEQWNLSTQYAFTPSMGLTMDYVGGAGRHQQTFGGLNSPAALAFPGTNMQPYTAFPLLGGAWFDTYEGKSSYNSLQAALEKRMSANLSFLATYTYAHSLDTGSSQLGQAPFRNIVLIPLNDEMANSNFDLRQRVSFNGNYTLPFGRGRLYLNQNRMADYVAGGWSAALTFAAQTGNPISISPNITTAAGGGAYAFKVGDPFKAGGTPNATNPGITCASRVRTLTHWFNPCAFANPIPGNQITGLVTTEAQAVSYLGPTRYQTFGPGFNNTNLSVFKNFVTVREEYLQFRADIFNVWNTPAYGDPSDSSINSISGYILGARSLGAYTPDARFIQFALKYYF